MQPGRFNYSESGNNSGCCLYCDNAGPGCLCFECKCSSCLNYTAPQNNDGVKGVCDISEERKEGNNHNTYILKNITGETALAYLGDVFFADYNVVNDRVVLKTVWVPKSLTVKSDDIWIMTWFVQKKLDGD